MRCINKVIRYTKSEKAEQWTYQQLSNRNRSVLFLFRFNIMIFFFKFVFIHFEAINDMMKVYFLH